MRPLLGEFLASASERIEAVTRFNGPLPDNATRPVVRELDRLVAVVTRFAAKLALDDEADRRLVLDRQEPRSRDAREALRRATANMRAAAGLLGTSGDDYPHSVATHLADAADHLAAGHDLVETHFAPGPLGSRIGRSEWAPIIVSAPVGAALLADLAGFGFRVAEWAGRVLVGRRPDEALPAEAHAAVSAACHSLRSADLVTRHAGRQLFTRAERALAHVIPAHLAPARYQPGGREPVSGLYAGIAHTAERLRYLAPVVSARGDGADAGSSAGWQRTAHGAAISGHCSELILRSLADRAAQLAMNPGIETGLRRAADATATSWEAWRAVAHAWDSLTTASSTRLIPVAAEIGDLVLWVGRLAHTDPAWAPGRATASGLRDPAALAAGREDVVNAIAAVHQANDTLARIAAHDHAAVRRAHAYRRIYVPTRLLSARYNVPYRYALPPRRMANALLSFYDAAVNASTQAAAALDSVAMAADAPSKVLAPIRAANKEGMPHLPNWDSMPDQPSAAYPRRGRVERRLHGLGIREPALLERAAAIDQAAHDLIAEAKSRSGRQDVLIGRNEGAKGSQQAVLHAARVAARDIPNGAGPLADRGARKPATPTGQTGVHLQSPRSERGTAVR